MAAAQGAARKRRFPLFQWLLVAGLLSLVWYAFGANVLSPASQQAILPDKVAGLELAGKVEGVQAIEQVSKLHGVDIKLASAYIGEYAKGNERATVWIADATSRGAATELLDRMVRGIEKGGSGFENLRRFSVAGIDVWQVDGMPGEKYYFYHSAVLDTGVRVVWLTIQSANPSALIGEMVGAF